MTLLGIIYIFHKLPHPDQNNPLHIWCGQFFRSGYFYWSSGSFCKNYSRIIKNAFFQNFCFNRPLFGFWRDFGPLYHPSIPILFCPLFNCPFRIGTEDYFPNDIRDHHVFGGKHLLVLVSISPRIQSVLFFSNFVNFWTLFCLKNVIVRTRINTFHHESLLLYIPIFSFINDFVQITSIIFRTDIFIFHDNLHAFNVGTYKAQFRIALFITYHTR